VTTKGRARQRQRTRKDLLSAAARLMKDGRAPTVAEVAEEAQISRATAYRYFPSQDTLLVEAPLDGQVPDPERLFARDLSVDPEARIDKAEKALHDMCYANEPQLRRMLSRSLAQGSGRGRRNGTPVRQNRRGPLIAAALEPVRDRLDDATYGKLEAALACFFGTESMIVFRDVLNLGPRKAREVKRWAIRTLVLAALDESSRAAPHTDAPRNRRRSRQ
jgi:AcrR family transcriptional regulator